MTIFTLAQLPLSELVVIVTIVEPYTLSFLLNSTASTAFNWITSNWHVVFLVLGLALGVIAFGLWLLDRRAKIQNEALPKSKPVRDANWNQSNAVAPVRTLPTMIEPARRAPPMTLQQVLEDNCAAAMLIVQQTPAGLMPAKRVPLTKLPFTLGRKDCDLTINEPRVSRKHAKIISQGSDFYLIDLNSSNFTFIGGEQVEPGKLIQLRPNATIALGRRTILKFEF